MRGFQGRDDAFHFRQGLEGLERFVVGGVVVFNPPRIAQEAVFWSDRRIIETGRDRMGRLDLPVLIGQEKRFASLQYAEFAALEARGVASGFDPLSAGFDPDHADVLVLEKGIEKSDRIAPATHAGHEQVGQALLAFEDLAPRLLADHAVEVAHHHGVRMRAVGRAEDVVGRTHIGHPVAHRFVDRLLQRGLAGGDRHDFCPEKFHPRDIQGLPLHVHLAHVDHAVHAESRSRRRRGHAVLTGAGLGNDPFLAHAARENDLAHRVVDLVRAGMDQVLALEINFRPSKLRGEALGQIKRGRPPDKFGQQLVQFPAEFRILPRRLVSLGQFLERRHQRLGHEDSAIRTKVARGVGLAGDGGAHEKTLTTDCTNITDDHKEYPIAAP